MNDRKDVAYALASNIARTRFEDLPDKAMAAAKKSILDTLGIMIGATGITPAPRRGGPGQGGRGEARVHDSGLWREDLSMDGRFRQWRHGPLPGL